MRSTTSSVVARRRGWSSSSDRVTGLGSVELFWLPLGAGGRSVRMNGRLFEAVAARREGRLARDLYHSALVVTLDSDRFVVEMAPAWTGTPADRGVVAEGPVGMRAWGRSIVFRYEIRRWRGGVIPDLRYAVGRPRLLSADEVLARRVLELVPAVPILTWGRDEQHVGEMWNSNSVTSWLLSSSGHDVDTVTPPGDGRAPGWLAGLAVAGQQGDLHRASGSSGARGDAGDCIAFLSTLQV